MGKTARGHGGRGGGTHRPASAVLAVLALLAAAALPAGCERTPSERALLLAASRADRLGGLRIEEREPLAAPPGAERTVTIAVTGNLNGWVTTATVEPKRRATGLAHLVPRLRSLRRDDPGLVLLDTGDALNGAPSTTLDTEADGRPALEFPVLPLMNDLGYDAIALGNFDLALGWPALAHARFRSDFPWLSANLERRDPLPHANAESGAPEAELGTELPPYRVLERHGVRIGVLGLTTPAAGVGRDPRLLQGMAFADLEAAAARWVPILRDVERVDVLVGLVHGGLDGGFGREEALRAGTPLFAAAGRLADGPLGFDLVIAGDPHRLSPKPGADPGPDPHGAAVLEPGFRGDGLTVARVHLAGRHGRWQVVRVERHTLRAAAKADPEALVLSGPVLRRTAARLAEATAVRFRRRPFKGEFYRCAGALSHAAAVRLTGERDAVTLLPMRWRYRPPARDELGTPVRRVHLYRWIPYGDTLARVRLTGRQVALLLDGWVRHERGWRVPAPDVLWPGGLEVTLPAHGSEPGTLRLAAPPGEVGAVLAPDDPRPVWLTDFIARGGLGLAPRVLLDPTLPPQREVHTTLRAGLFTLLSDPAFAIPPQCARWLEH